jgi:hypothetical protein
MIHNRSEWLDSDGQPIYAHKGGMFYFQGVYYWYGSDYRFTPRGGYDKHSQRLNPGINVYSSNDLVNWKFRRIAMAYPTKGWGSKGIHHRAHVIYNSETKTFVMWFYHYPPDNSERMATVAISDNPLGPFQILGQRKTDHRLANDEDAIGTKTEMAQGGRDLNLFRDIDGSAFLLYDNHDHHICITKLSNDYLYLTKETSIALNNTPPQMSPAMVRYQGKYIVAASGLKEWSATETHYAVASSPLGPFGEKKCMSRNNTWQSQITDLVYIKESDNLMVMCDQWWFPDSSHVNKSGYQWLPVMFDADKEIAQIKYVEKWNPLGNLQF